MELLSTSSYDLEAYNIIIIEKNMHKLDSGFWYPKYGKNHVEVLCIQKWNFFHINTECYYYHITT